MGKAQPSHREGCMCAICRRERGEIRRTKKTFAATINLSLLSAFREFAGLHHTSLSAALEEAMRLYMSSFESYDEEPLTDEELQGIKEGMADIRAGRVYDAEDVFRELGV
jgi:predicted transcriptional regulator